MDQSIYLIGLNHKTAGVEVRERFALDKCLKDGMPVIETGGRISEAVILSTCNRVELLVVGTGPDLPGHVLEKWACARGRCSDDLRPYVYIHEGREAIKHLYTVACSLDSMVLGEPQILGQLKQAYRDAVERGATRVVLNRMIHKAFSAAKRVRTETAIGSSAVSISYAAVELAKRIFGDMEGRRAMLIGAGEMAELAATHLLQSGVESILVANRTYQRAVELAKGFDGEAVPFDALFDRLSDVDIVISSTGAPDAVIRAKDVKDVLRRRKNRPMFFIDIAVPRDIDPDVNNLDNIYLYDIDDLREVVEENLATRRDEAAKAHAIVDDQVEEFLKWLDTLDLQPTIVELLDFGHAAAEEELAKTLRRLGPDTPPEVREALEAMTHALVKKLYHRPITWLRRRAQEEESGQRHIDTVRRIFNLDDDVIPPEAHRDRKHGLADSDCIPAPECRSCDEGHQQ